MKNLSCFECYYHKCINKNICTKGSCKLPEGKFYKTKDRIGISEVEEIKETRGRKKRKKYQRINHKKGFVKTWLKGE